MSKYQNPKSYIQNSSIDSISELSESRIITKNLVYVIGLSQNIAVKEILIKFEYFGQYGKIVKIVINKKKAYNQNNPYGPSFSAYVTYSKPTEASIAILSLDDTVVDNHLIRASFGTTKYCSFYLKNMECTNKDCLFLHRKADDSDIIKREDLNVNKNIFYEQQLYAIKIADIYNPEVKKKLLLGKNRKTMFPSTDLIYQNEIVVENEPIVKRTTIIGVGQKKTQKNTKKFTEDNNSNNSSATLVVNDLSKLDEKITSRKINKNSLKLEISSIKSIRDDATCSSTGDEKLSTSTPRGKNIFCNREKSRFDFVKRELSQEKEVPEFVIDIIDKKYKMATMSRYCKDFDVLLLNSELLDNKIDTNDQWTQFILSNTHYTIDKQRIRLTHKKDEYIKDIENINRFIFSKTNYKY